MAYTDSEKIEPLLIDELEKLGWADMAESIGVTGCERQCFRPATKTIGLIGSGRKHYQFKLMGSESGRFQGVPLLSEDGSAVYLRKVPRERVVGVIDTLFRFYMDNRLPEEDMGAFHRRVGHQGLIEHLQATPATADVMKPELVRTSMDSPNETPEPELVPGLKRDRMKKTRHFPVYLNLEGKRCVVAGGDATALSKIKSLLETGADVVVVAPRVEQGILTLHQDSRIEWLQKEFKRDDADGAFLVVSTLDDRERNQEIFDFVNARNRLVNVHDDAPRCNFIYPAVAQSGPVQVAVSTAGKSPAMAQRIRNRIEEEILAEGVGDLVTFIGSRRNESSARYLILREARAFLEGASRL